MHGRYAIVCCQSGADAYLGHPQPHSAVLAADEALLVQVIKHLQSQLLCSTQYAAGIVSWMSRGLLGAICMCCALLAASQAQSSQLHEVLLG